MTLSTIERMGGGTALLAVIVAGVTTLRPLLVPDTAPVQTVFRTLSSLEPRTVGLAVAAVTGILLLTLLLFSRPTKATDETFRRLRDAPPENVTVTGVDQAGTEFDADISAGRSNKRDQLRKIAVAEVAFDNGETAAEDVVATGKWTENRPAALFVGDEVEPTLFERLRTWLDPESEHRRRMLATIEAIETKAEEGQR
jgi:hypothetical protein